MDLPLDIAERAKIAVEIKEALRKEMLGEMENAIMDFYFPQHQVTDWQKALTLNCDSVVVRTKGFKNQCERMHKPILLCGI